MSEKEYIVSLNAGVNYDQFWQEMETQTIDHPNIPDRSVDIISKISFLFFMMVFAMTLLDEQGLFLNITLILFLFIWSIIFRHRNIFHLLLQIKRYQQLRQG